MRARWLDKARCRARCSAGVVILSLGAGPQYCPCHRCSVCSPGEWYPGGTAYSMGGPRLLVVRCRKNKSLKCLKCLKCLKLPYTTLVHAEYYSQ